MCLFINHVPPKATARQLSAPLFEIPLATPGWNQKSKIENRDAYKKCVNLFLVLMKWTKRRVTFQYYSIQTDTNIKEKFLLDKRYFLVIFIVVRCGMYDLLDTC